MTDFMFIQIFGTVGMVVVILAIVAVGWWDNAKISDWKFAAERFAQDFPEHVAKSGRISQNGKAALLLVRLGDEDRIGVVTTMGDVWNTRLLSKADTVLKPHKSGLLLSMKDLTFPKQKILLPRDVADEWIDRFKRSGE